MTGSPELSILIVNYNSRELVRETIASVERETQLDYEVICVDNDSSDGSADAIAEWFPWVRLIRSENIGFAAGNNLAAQYARGRRLLLLNPDTVILEEAIDRVVSFAERTPESGIWGGRTLFADRTLHPASCHGDMTPWSLFCRAVGLTRILPGSELFNPESIGGWERDTEREVAIVTGCFLLIDRALWDRLGGFDPTFFMYGEEADLALRARALGARPKITPSATLIHDGGGTEPFSAEKMIKVMRGKATVMNVHWSPPQRWLGRRLFLLLVGVRALGSRVIRPPEVHGAFGGSGDGIWPTLWRRRGEWLDGWPVVPRDGSSGRA